MSFRIYGAGSGAFRHEVDNNPDEDIFVAATVMSAMRSMDQPTVGTVAQAGVESVTPSSGGAILGALQWVALQSSVRNLNLAVTTLASRSGAAQGWIDVHTRRSNLLTPNASGYARYDFSPNVNPGSEFIGAINNALEVAGMNNYGVMNALANMLNHFAAHPGSARTPTILIQLSR